VNLQGFPKATVETVAKLPEPGESGLPDEHVIKNGYLIAAAPALLEVVKILVEAFESDSIEDARVRRTILDDGRDAISYATAQHKA